jgi:hypothetical protein
MPKCASKIASPLILHASSSQDKFNLVTSLAALGYVFSHFLYRSVSGNIKLFAKTHCVFPKILRLNLGMTLGPKARQ